MSIDVDCRSFISGIDLIKKAYPGKVERFMVNEGNKLRRRAVKNARKTVKKKTGHYEEGIKRGKHYIYRGNGGNSIRVYNDARHAHLIEYGHMVQTNQGEEFRDGKHIMENTQKEFAPKYEKDVENFYDNILDLLD